ncbi:Periplasmic binding protein [Brucella suis]|nr:Periplasmic binding protein [Brucella suis]
MWQARTAACLYSFRARHQECDRQREEWPTVGWETIAKSDPTMIIAGKMDRRRYPADDIAVKRKFLETDPVASLMPAVKDGHVFDMDAQAMNPTIRTIEGIETLADAIAAAGLNK